YYRLSPEDPRYYMDFTGTGNSLNVIHPNVLRLIMDSLRYWVTECHVDGFRFDLAATLARELHDVDRLSAFFDLIQQDPVVQQVKLIAEPWDVGEGGYQVGNFPPSWSEWNGRYRDNIRDVWRSRAGGLNEFASRVTGSSDLYEAGGRRPHASINFVTAHDGFTLADLVAYNDKHNEANGEGGRDGTDDNRSWNCGVEGPTEDPQINELRARQQRNLLATLLFSQGVPMLLAGDEMGRTQGGNNNAYALDDEVSWVHWDAPDSDLLEFSRRLIAYRTANPVLHRRRFLRGHTPESDASPTDDVLPDSAWFTPAGTEMTVDDWQAGPDVTALWLNGDLGEVGRRGEEIRGTTTFLVFNPGPDDVNQTLPPALWGRVWSRSFDTAIAQPTAAVRFPAGAVVTVDGRSVVVLELLAEDVGPTGG
ncbi:MAG: glycogen debranching protein, partial [Acidimicrobiales bacterium]